MPNTKGSGNPDWNRDETLLALDLLYKHCNPIHKGHEDVVDLSTLLQAAKFHPVEKQLPSFRNPDGVALKLQNLLSAIEPKRGLSSSLLDREIIAEYPKERALEVELLASLIRQAIARGDNIHTIPKEELFIEGNFLTSQHRSRDNRLRKKLLSLRDNSQLVCDICDFIPPLIERPLQESFFEAHHIRPLSDTKGATSTRVSDMSLLCANCHRFIHKLIAHNKRWFSIAEARASRCNRN